jgi:uncharacterized membrane protein YphA (DoxX/SURF4 family)
MNIVLWIIQILLALLFILAGVPKLVFPIEKLIAMGPPNQVILPGLLLRFIGVCELLGAFGLVLPGIFRIQTYLTPLAAIGLAIIMVGAVVVSAMGTGIASAILPLVIGLLCVFIAYGRTKMVPLASR